MRLMFYEHVFEKCSNILDKKYETQLFVKRSTDWMYSVSTTIFIDSAVALQTLGPLFPV
jgi:hypothetical protein